MLGSCWCVQDTLLCQTASSAVGQNSQQTQSITWENVFIECSFIKLPVNRVRAAAEQSLLTVSGWHQLCEPCSDSWKASGLVSEPQLGFESCAMSLGPSQCWGLMARVLSEPRHTQWSAGVSLCPPKPPKMRGFVLGTSWGLRDPVHPGWPRLWWFCSDLQTTQGYSDKAPNPLCKSE